MSSGLPPVEGYDGPFPLKMFLHKFFDVELRYKAPAASSSTASAATTRTHDRAGSNDGAHVLYLEISPDFMVSVYAAVGASAPVLSAHIRDKGTRGAALPSPMAFLGAPRSPSRAAPSYTSRFEQQLRALPLADAILRQPLFVSLLDALGPAGTAFLSACCAVVVQFDVTGGGLQVMGRSLYDTAAGAIDGPCAQRKHFHVDVSARRVRRGGGRARGRMSRARSEADLAEEPLAKSARTEARDERAACRAKPPPPPHAILQKERSVVDERCVNDVAVVSTSSLLGQTDVPRMALVHGSRSAALLRTCPPTLGTAPSPLPAEWLELLWLRQHPSSRDRLVTSLLTPAQCRRARRQQRSLARETVSKSVCTAACGDDARADDSQEGVSMEMVRTVFPYSLEHHGQASTAEDTQSVVPPSAFLPTHLRKLLQTTVDQLARVDVRGAALRHTAHLERRCYDFLRGRCSQPWTRRKRREAKRAPSGGCSRKARTGPQTIPLSSLLASPELLVAYLKDILRQLRYTTSNTNAEDRNNGDGRNHSSSNSGSGAVGGRPGSFWGATDETSARVLDAITEALRLWLSPGAAGAFPLSSFLNKVPVGSIPWLHNLYTDATNRNGRARRSMLQQRVFMQYMFFLTQHILPFLVRRSFHVTWSTKGGGGGGGSGARDLLFVPQAVWRRLLRCHIRALQQRRGRHDCEDAGKGITTPQPAQWELLAHHGGSASSLPGPDGLVLEREANHTTCGTPLLYAAVRFLPDGKKLRPIARVRRADCRGGGVRALLRLVRKRQRYQHSWVAPLLRHMGVQERNASWLSTPMASVDPSSSRASAGHTQQRAAMSERHVAKPEASALLLRHALMCITHGMEERRRSSRNSDAGVPELMPNPSHAQEYTELRAFSSAVRRLAQEAAAPEQATIRGFPVRVHMVRADAAKCYDRLNQATVVRAIEELVRHDRYHIVDFHSLRTEAMSTSVRPAPAVAPLQRHTWHRLLSDADMAKGIVPNIPAGWIVQEQRVRGGSVSSWTSAGAQTPGRLHRTSVSAHGTITENTCIPRKGSDVAASPPLISSLPGSATTGTDSRVLDGAAMRRVLIAHVQDHLVALEGRLYRQRRGIVQGSPVAMLLCDILLLHVDGALANVLAEHQEPALQMRRVDDVLVATTSAVAAQRCWSELVTGWPELGYVCQEEKLRHATARFHVGGPHGDIPRPVNAQGCVVRAHNQPSVPWCGLLLYPHDLSVSVEWRRLSGSLDSLHHGTVARCRSRHAGSWRGAEECLVSATHHLMTVIRLRTPATAVCRVLNTRARVLQTVLEAALVWARLLTRILADVIAAFTTPTTRAPSLSVAASLLTRPSRACAYRLGRLLRQHHPFLLAHQSFCNDIGTKDVSACVATALSLALERQPPALVTTARRQKDGRSSSRTLWWRLRHVARGLAKAATQAAQHEHLNPPAQRSAQVGPDAERVPTEEAPPMEPTDIKARPVFAEGFLTAAWQASQLM